MERQTNEVERISVTSSKPFEAVVDALDRAMGHPNVAEQQISEGTGSFAVSVIMGDGARTIAESRADCTSHGATITADATGNPVARNRLIECAASAALVRIDSSSRASR